MSKPTFSPEALAAIVNAVAAEMAKKGKSTAMVTAMTGGKSERSLANEKLCKTAFKKAGFGVVVPHDDVRSFGKWVEAGYRPIEGTKAVKVKNLRLFHRSQVRPLTVEDEIALADKQAAKSTGNVVPMTEQVRELQ